MPTSAPTAERDCCVVCGAPTDTTSLCSPACRSRAVERAEELHRARRRLLRVRAANQTDGPLARLLRPVTTWRRWQAERDLAWVGARLDPLRWALAHDTAAGRRGRPTGSPARVA